MSESNPPPGLADQLGVEEHHLSLRGQLDDRPIDPVVNCASRRTLSQRCYSAVFYRAHRIHHLLGPVDQLGVEEHHLSLRGQLDDWPIELVFNCATRTDPFTALIVLCFIESNAYFCNNYNI